MALWQVNPDGLSAAAEALARGGLVAFPTETVYGLGADATNVSAVARIFEAKGRPASNPVIVHVADVAQARTLAADWPPLADRLADAFWPGPLTLVLPKHPLVSDLITAGGATVAVRVPAHPVALELLRRLGKPIAAPSANRSTQLSPTRADHVLRGLGSSVDVILDGGPTPGGLESTVLDLTTSPPTLLRPGLIDVEQLEACIGPIVVRKGMVHLAGTARSPGLMDRHYAPRARMELGGRERALGLQAQGLRVGWLTYSDVSACEPGVERILLPMDVAGYSAGLYDALHRLDDAAVERIVVEPPPAGDRWLAVADRLSRAQAGDAPRG